jgi:nucleotide-binding universal stress UspA family protein
MNKAHMKILVPIDFSEESKNGLQTAIDIAKNKGGEIIIFHVLSGLENLMEQWYKGMSSVSNAFEKGVAQLKKEEAKTKSELESFAKENGMDNLRYSITIVSGKYNEELSNYLKEHDVNIIVAGTSGNISLEEYFSGNKVEQSMRLSEVPVLAVKKRHKAAELKNLLLGVELKKYDFKVIEEIKKFTDYLEMKIYFVYVKHSVFEEADEILKQLQQFAKKYEFKNYSLNVMPIGDTRKRLDEFAEKNNINVIAMITKGEHGIFRLIFESQTDKMVEKSKHDVLSIHK